MRVSSRDGAGMTNGDTVNSGAAAGSKPGRWIGDISAERVDSVWRTEDHEAVIHNLQGSSEMAPQVVALAARDAVGQFQNASQERMSMEANPKLNIRGLRLPPPTVKRLGEIGIFARPEVSLEYQSLTKRYVV